MARRDDRDQQRRPDEKAEKAGKAGTPGKAPQAPRGAPSARMERPHPSPPRPRGADGRAVYELRGARYRLTSRQVEVLNAIGAFRAVRADDIQVSLYDGNRAVFEAELRPILDNHLAQHGRVHGDPEARYLSLTPAGKDFAENHLKTHPDQALYAGVRKPKELHHDAALYRLYVKKAEEIRRAGGRPTRVVLDYEFKRKLAKRVNDAARLPEDERRKALAELADAHRLTVVDDKIPVPDLRVEYETAEGDLEHCDLEYVTDNYRAAAIVEKASAGFTLYTSDGSICRKVRDEYPSLAAQVLSL